MNKGYVSLFLVLMMSLGISICIYQFFTNNSYYLFLKKDYFVFETKRMVAKVCFDLIAEKVYSGQTPEWIQAIFVSKQVFNVEYDCRVLDTRIEHLGNTITYTVDVKTPFGFKEALYTISPGVVHRVIISS